MPTVKIKWTDNAGNKQTRQIKHTHYSNNFADYESIKCGKLSGSGLEQPFVVYFERLYVEEKYIKLAIADDSFVLEVSVNSVIYLELVDPVPVPLPHGLRTRLTAELDNCYVSLFELKTGKLVSGGLLSGSWNQMPAKIEQLMGSNLRNYHFRVLSDVLDISGPLSLSEIFSSHNFPVYSCKSLILYRHRAGEDVFLFEDRYVTTEDLPALCKAAIKAVLARDPHLERSLMRRIIVTALNGGLALDHLSLIGWNGSFALFRQLNINFTNSAAVNLQAAKALLKTPIETFRRLKGLFRSEEGYCCGFWYPCLFAAVLEFGLSVDLEWPTTSIDPSIDLRYVDGTILIKLVDGNEIPLLLLEAGREEVPAGSFHKDHGKMLGLMTWNCRAMAERLSSQGKDPSKAVCFGWLIGGNDLQVFTACTQGYLNGSVNEFVVNVKSFPHGHINLLTGLSHDAACTNSCCRSIAACFASFVGDSKPNEPIPDLNAFLPATRNVSIQGTGDGSLTPASAPAPISADLLLEHAVHEDAIKAIYFLLEGMIGFSSSILQAPASSHSGSSVSRSSSSLLTRSTSGTNQESPCYKHSSNGGAVSGRLIVGGSHGSGSLGKAKKPDQEVSPLNEPPKHHVMLQESFLGVKSLLFKLKKKLCWFELSLYRTLSVEFPVCFPRLLDAITDEATGTIEYSFERMQPCLEFGVRVPSLFTVRKIEVVVYESFELLLGVSLGLALLHVSYEVVHCDISPNNILFSYVNKCFKINDFNHATYIDDALKHPRTAGTRGFRAPEAEESGIFTPASDIYALGKTCLHVFGGIFKWLTSGEPEIVELRALWLELMEHMTLVDPQLRPDALTCVRIALYVTGRFDCTRNALVAEEARAVLKAVQLSCSMNSIEECRALLSKGPEIEMSAIAENVVDEKENL